MPTYYDHGLGLDDPTQITESGDELASAANYIEPENVDYAHYTWESQPISESVTRLIRDEDFPQLSSPLIYITIPSGSPHNIYDSTNTVLVSGIADENNDREYTLDYQLTGASADTGDITPTTAWSFTTLALEFGNTVVRTNIVSDMGPRAYDSVIISRSPSVAQGSPVVTITTPTTAPTATTFYDETDIGGTAVDPNSLPIQRVDYTATAYGDELSWIDVTSNEYWTAIQGAVWNGSSWDCAGIVGAEFEPLGGWEVGFRPTAFRFTYTGGILDQVRLEDKRPNTIAYNGAYASGVTIPITWGTGENERDLLGFQWWNSGAPAGVITQIELFGTGGVLGTDISGKATGTDNWSFTVPLILGDTTVDVTGSNTYSLSGSDSIVVTRTPALNPIVTITTPTTGTSATIFYDTVDIGGTAVDPNPLPITSVVYTSDFTSSDNGFLYDEFDDASLDPRWNRESGSGSTAEQNDRLEITCQSEAAYFFGQDFSEETIDVWGKLEAGFTPTEGQDLGYTLRFRLRDENSLDYVWIGLKWNAESSPGEFWEISGRHWEQGVGSHSYATGDISQDYCWVRVKWQSGQSYIRIFYSLTEPVVEDDWTEFVPTTWFPVFSGSDFSFEFVSGTDQPGDRIGYGWNATYLQPSSQESGTAIGTDNWNFTVPLNLGSLDIDVTGINSYSVSGSDSIVITRAVPQNPVVTITTETTGASALEFTVDGIASDPNNFTITNVSFVTIADITGDTVQYFDNTEWQDGGDVGTFIWDGSKWTISSGGVDHSLEPIGAWSSGYRPLSIILNGGPFAAGVTIKDTNSNVIGQDANPTSGDQIDLTFTDYDIGKLTCGDVDSNMVITNIRFVEADATITVDSGDATGTTDWTLDTVLSSAGDNTITVTAVDDYSPPLSGSDTLIVTYSPPESWLDTFFYDDFNDGSIHANWTQVVEGEIDEGGGDLTMTTDADGSQEIYQTLDSHLVVFDVWGELEIDNSVNDINARIRWQQDGTGQWFMFEIEEDYGDITCYCRNSDGVLNSAETVDMGSSYNMYLRMRYRPDLGDTHIRGFYSTTLPTQEIDWTEFTPATYNCIPDDSGTTYTFRLQSNNNNGAVSHTDTFYDVIEWTG